MENAKMEMQIGTEADDGGHDRDFVSSLARGLEVIKAFDRQSPKMTLSDIARKTGLTRASARRFLLTLEKIGYVHYDSKHFELTAKVLELGYAYLSSLALSDLAAPFMEEIVREVQESCSASVLVEDEIVYIARIPTARIMSVSLDIGTKLPAFCTSMGRVLLAALPETQTKAILKKTSIVKRTQYTITDKEELLKIIQGTRRDGYAIVDQELELGLRSIAVPIVDRRGAVRASINISAHASRATAMEMKGRYLEVLRGAAEKICRVLP
jgi:IclR family pca regulon transcriptional regulator